eukprot:10428979-Ditylum_brightwellii.AAC.1
MTSDAECKVGALFPNCKATVEMHIALEEMGHKYHPTAVIQIGLMQLILLMKPSSNMKLMPLS